MLVPDTALDDIEHTDVVIVPTAGMELDAARRNNARVVEWLAQHGRSGDTIVAGICTGVTLVAAAGLLSGRRATTHWALLDTCRAMYPDVDWQPHRLITECHNIYCGGGVYASVDLSLYLVERLCGHEVAVRTAKALLLDTPRMWQPGQAAAPPRSQHDDDQVRRAQQWLFDHFREEVFFEELAARVGMSPRNFARRFKAATGDAPLAYLHGLRIDAARHLLENEMLSVQEISRAVGYDDVTFFRRLFQRHTGATPRGYRARFGLRRPA